LVILDNAVLDRGNLVLFRSVDFLDPGFELLVVLVFIVAIIGGEVVDIFAVFVFLLRAQGSLFIGGGLLLCDQRRAVGRRDLVIVGMDFAEGEKAVPVAAEIDECRLQAGFYPGNLCEINIALDLLVFGRFEIELLNPVSLEHRHPCFFRVARIDKHARCHINFSGRSRPIRSCRIPESANL